MEYANKSDLSECGAHITQNICKIHTTESGAERIKRYFDLQTDDVMNWCIQKIEQADEFVRKGKNWYVYSDYSIITVSAHSYTIITAHKKIEND